jgi:hypothetical protein
MWSSNLSFEGCCVRKIEFGGFICAEKILALPGIETLPISHYRRFYPLFTFLDPKKGGRGALIYQA